MRVLQILALAALTSAASSGIAMAEDRVHLTPPLYREQARATAAVRPAAELATTPRLTPAAPANPRIVAEASASSAR